VADQTRALRICSLAPGVIDTDMQSEIRNSTDALTPERPIILTEKILEVERTAGDFKPGEIFSASDLMKAMLVVSSNDAAEALANSYDYQNFRNLMRGKSFELEMNDTSFSDPSGLSILNQSTPADLEKLINYILKNRPEIFEITRANSIIKEISSGKARKILNNNKFAGRTDFLGGKTGYTDEAGGNLISLFQANGRKLLIIIFGSQDRFGETEKLRDWVKSNF